MKQTELITNSDGSIFHLHLLPEDISDRIILVGDPGRVEMIGQMMSSVRVRKSNREFATITGSYNDREVSVISTGIGTDNIDIVVNELDALVNFDLGTRQPIEDPRSLTFVRIGTSGALHKDIPIGSFVASEKAIGFDGLIHFYEGYEWCLDHAFADALTSYLEWPDTLAFPYVVDADPGLLENIASNLLRGITISAPGFYGPQGRTLRLTPFDSELNEKIAEFSFMRKRITNFEMESSAIYALSKMLGHKALTTCVIIANRVSGEFLEDYKPAIKELAQRVLEGLSY